MNVYDFDKTIYDGDSTLDFYFFCLRQQPGLFRCLPRQLYGGFCYYLGFSEKLLFKERFYSYLSKVTDVDEKIQKFWDCHERKIMSWYKAQAATDDVVISASAEFLLQEICRRLGIRHLLASKVDRHTGKCLSRNCYGAEKCTRYYASHLGREKIDNFYSDSYTDKPMADIAVRSFRIKGRNVYPWETWNK